MCSVIPRSRLIGLASTCTAGVVAVVLFALLSDTNTHTLYIAHSDTSVHGVTDVPIWEHTLIGASSHSFEF